MDEITAEFLQLGSGYRKHNGKYKYLTNNCASCKFHFVVEKQERCYWGVAWKKLLHKDALRECQYFNTPSPREIAHENILAGRKRLNDLVSVYDTPVASNLPKTYVDQTGRRERL